MQAREQSALDHSCKNQFVCEAWLLLPQNKYNNTLQYDVQILRVRCFVIVIASLYVCILTEYAKIDIPGLNITVYSSNPPLALFKST